MKNTINEGCFSKKKKKNQKITTETHKDRKFD